MSENLSVKELATALGRGSHYVYQMRRCGFAMSFDQESGLFVASLDQARDWIDRHGFVVRKGRGFVRRLVAAKGQP